jgi:hypothetical protein
LISLASVRWTGMCSTEWSSTALPVSLLVGSADSVVFKTGQSTGLLFKYISVCANCGVATNSIRREYTNSGASPSAALSCFWHLASTTRSDLDS